MALSRSSVPPAISVFLHTGFFFLCTLLKLLLNTFPQLAHFPLKIASLVHCIFMNMFSKFFFLRSGNIFRYVFSYAFENSSTFKEFL